jgi:hypothetical protein
LSFHNTGAGKYERMNLENPMKDMENLRQEILIPYKTMIESEGYTVKINGF